MAYQEGILDATMYNARRNDQRMENTWKIENRDWQAVYPVKRGVKTETRTAPNETFVLCLHHEMQ